MKRKIDWLAVAEAFEQISASIPEQDTATLADDYPEAWRELHKRRRVMTSGPTLLSLMSSGLLVLLLFNFLMHPGHIALHEMSALPWLTMFVFSLCVALNFYATTFKCPRCHKNFFQVNGRSADEELEDPSSRCQHCHLRIGEAPPQ